GVQTCALPISAPARSDVRISERAGAAPRRGGCAPPGKAACRAGARRGAGGRAGRDLRKRHRIERARDASAVRFGAGAALADREGPMSGAGDSLQAAAIAVLDAVSELGAAYLGPPVQAAYPYAVVDAGLESDWGHKSG